MPGTSRSDVGILAFVVLGTLLACGGASNEDLKAKLNSRARFDMRCERLALVPLEESNGRVTSYGVIGCGKRTTYVLNASTMSWVMNVEGGQPVAAPVQDPPPPTPPPPAPPPPVAR
jgi:hypothetical protein